MPEEVGGLTRWTSDEKDAFPIGSDVWGALDISDTMQIVLNAKGVMIDAWDSLSWDTFNVNPRIEEWLGTTAKRETPFDMGVGPKEPEDMTDVEIGNALTTARADYSTECRSVRVQQRSLKSKVKRIRELAQEKLERIERDKGQGYLRRLPRTVLTGNFAFRPISSRSYSRRYVLGGFKIFPM